MANSIGVSPLLPGWEYLADAEPHIFGERLYLIGSHDRFGGTRFCENNYVGWSAPLSDLSDWRFEGVTYDKTQDPANADGRLALWAPDAVQGEDGRFYLYYCLADHPRIGVAVCETPAGRYRFLDYVRDPQGVPLGQRPGDTRPFDPAVLRDDDGRIHLYAGQGPLSPRMARTHARTHCFVFHMELEADMITLRTEPRALLPNITNSDGTGFEGHEFFEASSIRKFDGRYYFIYSSVLSHELCWAVSDRPDSGFSYGGTLVSNGDIGLAGPVPMGYNSKANPGVRNYIGNTHGSVEKINGAYYVFYHRHTNRRMSSRQSCAAPITMTADGRFLQAEMTSCALCGDLPGTGFFEARIACQLFSANGALYSAHPMVQNRRHPAFTQDEPDAQEGRQYIANLRDGASAVYKYFRFGADTPLPTSLCATIRGKCSGSLLLRDETGALLASIPLVPARSWTSFRAPLRIGAGRHALCFTYQGRGYADFMDFTLL